MENPKGAEPPKRLKHSCKGCEKRHVGCHSECEAYQKYRESLDRYNDYAYKKRMELHDMLVYKGESARKIMKKKGMIK